MAIALDHFDVRQKQQYVVIGTTIGLVLAIVTYLARIYTRIFVTKNMYREDWWMGAAVFVTSGVAACLFYRMSSAARDRRILGYTDLCHRTQRRPGA